MSASVHPGATEAFEHFMIMFISQLAVAPLIGLYSIWRK
jgi:hypothetical protein